MPTYQEVLDTLKPSLKPGEQVIEAVAGAIAGESLNTVVALTSERVRVVSSAGGSVIELSNLAGVSWASAWARLNIDLKSPRKRIVLAVFGSEWKTHAKAFAEGAKRLVPK